MTEDKMVEWHHQLNRHEFEQVPGDGKGQGSLVWLSHEAFLARMPLAQFSSFQSLSQVRPSTTH